MTKVYLLLLRQNYFCHNKHVFVMTKIILVAAPANDILQGGTFQPGQYFLHVCIFFNTHSDLMQQKE